MDGKDGEDSPTRRRKRRPDPARAFPNQEPNEQSRARETESIKREMNSTGLRHGADDCLSCAACRELI